MENMEINVNTENKVNVDMEPLPSNIQDRVNNILNTAQAPQPSKIRERIKDILLKVSDLRTVEEFSFMTFTNDDIFDSVSKENFNEETLAELNEAVEKILKLKAKLNMTGRTIQFAPNLDYKNRIMLEVIYLDRTFKEEFSANPWQTDLDLDIPRVSAGRLQDIIYGQIARAGVNQENLRKVFKYMTDEQFGIAIEALIKVVDQSLLLDSPYGIREMHTFIKKDHKLVLVDIYKAISDELTERVETLKKINTASRVELTIDPDDHKAYYDNHGYIRLGYTKMIKRFTEFKVHYVEFRHNEYLTSLTSSVQTYEQYNALVNNNFDSVAKAQTAILVEGLIPEVLSKAVLPNVANRTLKYIDYINNTTIAYIIKNKEVNYSKAFSIVIRKEVKDAVREMGKH